MRSAPLSSWYSFVVEKETIRTSQAPAAIGPYSQAIAVKNNGMTFLYCSGQIPLDAQSGELVGNDVAAQTVQVFRNIRGVLAASGARLEDVVKTTVFLKDMADFAAMNAVYAEQFGNHAPARSTVAAAGLPRNVSVEIEVLAIFAPQP